jgi:hypothetical protein
VEGIFGRDLELAAMEQFLNSTPNWPSAMVIEGVAGIGKPRCGPRASGAQRNAACGLSKHSQRRASRSCHTLRSRIWSSRRSMR